MVALLLRAFRDLWSPPTRCGYSRTSCTRRFVGNGGQKFHRLWRAERILLNSLRRAWARDFWHPLSKRLLIWHEIGRAGRMQRQTWACGKGMAPEAGPRHREWAVGLRVKPERAATRHRASAAASTLPLHCKYRVFLQATTVRPAACRGRVLSGRVSMRVVMVCAERGRMTRKGQKCKGKRNDRCLNTRFFPACRRLSEGRVRSADTSKSADRRVSPTGRTAPPLFRVQKKRDPRCSGSKKSVI